MAAPVYDDSKESLIEVMRQTAGSGNRQFEIAKAIFEAKASEELGRYTRVHSNDVIRHMLQAESRRRQGISQSATDETLTRLLARRVESGLVVTYDERIGFAFAVRESVQCSPGLFPIGPLNCDFLLLC